jgi:hypothetical protein
MDPHTLKSSASEAASRPTSIVPRHAVVEPSVSIGLAARLNSASWSVMSRES